MQFSPTAHFTFTVERKPKNSLIKKAGNQTEAEWCKYFTTAFTSALPLLGYFIFYLRVMQRPPLYTSSRAMPCLSANWKLKELPTKIQPCRPKSMTLSHLGLYSRTFPLPLPLSDEGKCQETVEDSPLLWTFSTWRIFWYDSHTKYDVT